MRNQLQLPFHHLDDLEEREIIPGFRGRFVHSENITLGYWRISSGAVLPEHAHPHEQVTNVLQGRLEMTIEGKTRTLEAGGIAVIPAEARHGAKALTDCFVIDAFYPVREDYQ
jgi:quercetin dioxygenase-like cupin family protein